MALPWLLGAAAAAVAIAALSDDSSGSSTSYSDNEDEERRRAAKEREERQREEKMEALEASYYERLELEGMKMTELLRNFVEVDDMQRMVIIESVMDLEMNPDGSDKNLLTRQIVQNKRTLDTFHSNIAFFEQLYGAYVEPKIEVVQVSEAIDSLKKQTKKIDKLIKELS